MYESGETGYRGTGTGLRFQLFCEPKHSGMSGISKLSKDKGKKSLPFRRRMSQVVMFPVFRHR